MPAGGGHRVVNGFLTVQLEHSLVEDIPAAAVQVQGRGLAQGVALGIGDHGGHRAVLAPPFMVGARQDVAACRQGQGVGQGLARFIFAAVDAGRGLVSGGAVALGTGIRIDKTARRVWVNGEEKQFTTKEFDLLTFLAEHPNHVFTKEELFREIWDMESIGDIATVTVHIKKIREKIEMNTNKPQYIETIWGVGYRFKL